MIKKMEAYQLPSLNVGGSIYTIKVITLVNIGFDFGLHEYPIFDEDYREVLNAKLINHYAFYEIGFETETMFKTRLNIVMNEIMPYYNQLYDSTLIEYDPITNFKYTETLGRVGSSGVESGTISSSHGTGKNKAYDLKSTSPQNFLSSIKDNLTDAKSADSGDFTETETDTNNDVGSSSLSAGVTTDNYVKQFDGYNNSNPAALLTAFRNSLINVDMMIIDDVAIQRLFMQIL